MTETDINVPRIEDADRVIRRVESVLTSHGLTMHSRGTVKSYPGCTHWHFKDGKHAGTLEVTYWPAKRRVWFKVQAKRTAAWIDQLVPVLKEDLEKG